MNRYSKYTYMQNENENVISPFAGRFAAGFKTEVMGLAERMAYHSPGRAGSNSQGLESSPASARKCGADQSLN